MPILNADYSVLNQEEMAVAIGLKVKHIPMLIGSFLEESKAILSSLEELIESKNYTKIKEASHSLKGSSGNLRYNEVYEMAKEMELAGSNSDEDFDYLGYLEAMKSSILTISI